jgi:hypothetical protein
MIASTVGAISPPICFIPGDEGIVVPVCVAGILGGPEPGSAAQLPKAVVHHHNSGTPSRSRTLSEIHPGNNRILRHSSSAAMHRQQPAPDAVLHARSVLGEAEHLGGRALRQSSSAAIANHN